MLSSLLKMSPSGEHQFEREMKSFLPFSLCVKGKDSRQKPKRAGEKSALCAGKEGEKRGADGSVSQTAFETQKNPPVRLEPRTIDSKASPPFLSNSCLSPSTFPSLLWLWSVRDTHRNETTPECLLSLLAHSFVVYFCCPSCGHRLKG